MDQNRSFQTREEDHQPHQHTLHLGSTAICVQDDEFQHGYQQGYQRFHQMHARRQVDDHTIATFLAGATTNTMASARENAGYITGWFSALLRRQECAYMPAILNNHTDKQRANLATNHMQMSLLERVLLSVQQREREHTHAAQ